MGASLMISARQRQKYKLLCTDDFCVMSYDQSAGEIAYPPQDQRNSDQNDVLHRHSSTTRKNYRRGTSNEEKETGKAKTSDA
jgi:hypothetical protein